MTLSPRFRKLLLTTHITVSVGWFGAIAGFFALSIAGLTNQNAQMVRAAYLAMELIGWYVIVPCSLMALFTGLVQSLCTEWGLFKHYWVLVKFLLTVGATALLLLHMQPTSYLAEVVSSTPPLSTELRGLRIQLVADAGAALLVLLATTTISVFKPWGKIYFELGKKHEPPQGLPASTSTRKKSWGPYVLAGLVSLVLLVIIVHLFGSGLGNH